MKALFHLAGELENLFRKKGWKFCFIGGLALQRWGEPRVTQDVDVSLLTDLGSEKILIDELLKTYRGRLKDTKRFALKNRVLLLVSKEGIGIDIALAILPFEIEMVKRATSFEFLPGLELCTCSAEDLVVMKAFADRTRDWADLEGILIRQENRIDWPYIERQLKPLIHAKETPGISAKLKALRNKLS